MVVELRVSPLSWVWCAGSLLFAHGRPLGSRLASVASVPIGPSLPLSWGWRIWVQSGHCPLLHVKIVPRGWGTERRPVSLEISGRG